MSKSICDLRSGEKFTMADYPGMVLVAWVIISRDGMTRLTYKVDREGARFDDMVKPSLSTVYPA